MVVLTMGIGLVKAAVVVHAPNLSGRAFKVLIRMAAVALDKQNLKGQPPNLYFDGWEALALTIGQDPAGNERRAYEQVRRVLAELEAAGLIERLEDHPQTGRAQTFRLHLAATKTEGQSPPKRRGSRHQNGGNSPAKMEGPRKHEDEIKDSDQDANSILSASATDRVREPISEEAVA